MTMDVFRSKHGHEPLDDERPTTKRISTPAGRRLSLIIESTQSKSFTSPATKINVTTTSTYCNDPSHQHIDPTPQKTTKKAGVVSALTGGKVNSPRESSEERHPNGSNLSVSVWSDKDNEKFGHVRQNRRWAIARWGWKRIAIVVAIVLLLIIALAVGLAVGLKKKPSSSTTAPTSTSGNAQPGGTTTTTDGPSAPTATVPPSALPSGFPVGTFSLITFLDTVNTECTSINATWACPPNTNYYSDPQKALTILNWQISGSSGAYKISSNGEDTTFGTSFQNENLELLDSGKDTERYRFQISRTKVVNMTGSIGNARGSFECDYGQTNIQALLYTKMARTYPKDTIAVGNTGNPAWPFAVKIEQTVAGGDNVPSCKRKSGELVGGLKAQDAGTLCSCLYRNWNPNRPGS